jgi:CO dehydrogenase nickel-insertion accessory protein CooC1
MEKPANPEGLPLAGKRIGVFGKGGSGKSTATVLLARGLRDLGYEICVLDADSTNLGLPLALGMNSTPKPLMEYFGGVVFSGGLVTCPVDDPTLLPGSEIDLEKIPPQYLSKNQAGIHLMVGGKIGDQGPGAGCDGPISKIARDLRVNMHGTALLTLVDFKAGFEDSARGVLTSLDWAIVLVDPTIAAVEMAINMKDMIRQIKNGKTPATRHLDNPDLVAIANKLFKEAKIKDAFFLLNKIRNAETENFLRSKLMERKIVPSGVIYEDPSIYAAWLKGTPLENQRSQRGVLKFIKKMEAAEKRFSNQLAEPTRG